MLRDFKRSRADTDIATKTETCAAEQQPSDRSAAVEAQTASTSTSTCTSTKDTEANSNPDVTLKTQGQPAVQQLPFVAGCVVRVESSAAIVKKDLLVCNAARPFRDYYY